MSAEGRVGNGLDEVDPDYRFTLANERTFLAWIRTALGLLAGGVALVHVVPDRAASTAQRAMGVALSVLAVVVALSSIRRWRAVQDAMRRGDDLPPSRHPLYLGLAIAGLGAVVVAFLAFSADRL